MWSDVPDLVGGRTYTMAAESRPFTRGSRLGRTSDGSKENICPGERKGHFHSYITTCQPTQTGLLRPQQESTPVTPSNLSWAQHPLGAEACWGWSGQSPLGSAAFWTRPQNPWSTGPKYASLFTPLTDAKSLHHRHHGGVSLLK